MWAWMEAHEHSEDRSVLHVEIQHIPVDGKPCRSEASEDNHEIPPFRPESDVRFAERAEAGIEHEQASSSGNEAQHLEHIETRIEFTAEQCEVIGSQ